MINRLAENPSLLEVRGITKNFGGLQALSDVSLEVAEGEVLGLIGPNGSGKSTAFDVIPGLLPATSGTVISDGQDIISLPTHGVASAGIGRTFQLVRPFLRLTALDNFVAGRLIGRANFSSEREAESRAFQLLVMVPGWVPAADSWTVAVYNHQGSRW